MHPRTLLGLLLGTHLALTLGCPEAGGGGNHIVMTIDGTTVEIPENDSDTEWLYGTTSDTGETQVNGWNRSTALESVHLLLLCNSEEAGEWDIADEDAGEYSPFVDISIYTDGDEQAVLYRMVLIGGGSGQIAFTEYGGFGAHVAGTFSGHLIESHCVNDIDNCDPEAPGMSIDVTDGEFRVPLLAPDDVPVP